MSAINDALRRASSAAKSGPPASPLPPMSVPSPQPLAPPPTPEPPPIPVSPPPLPVAESRAAIPPLLIPSYPIKPRSGRALSFVMAALVFCIAGTAGFCFWWNKSHSAQAKTQVQPEEELTDNDRLAALFGDEKALGKVDRTDSSNPVPVKFAPAPRPPERPQPARATVATTPAPVPAPAPVVQSPVRFPPLRLQSIFYRPSSPSVIINGKTLFVTDEINGVTVADIQPSSVTLVLSGQTNVLTLR